MTNWYRDLQSKIHIDESEMIECDDSEMNEGVEGNEEILNEGEPDYKVMVEELADKIKGWMKVCATQKVALSMTPEKAILELKYMEHSMKLALAELQEQGVTIEEMENRSGGLDTDRLGGMSESAGNEPEYRYDYDRLSGTGIIVRCSDDATSLRYTGEEAQRLRHMSAEELKDEAKTQDFD